MADRPIVVLDTNVIVSALISSGSIPGVIFKRFRIGDFDLVTSNQQLDEIADVIARPALQKYINPREAKLSLSFLKSGKLARIVAPQARSWDFPDKKDHFLLDLIAFEGPQFLVTGDKLLLSLVEVKNTAIVSPAEFIQVL